MDQKMIPELVPSKKNAKKITKFICNFLNIKNLIISLQLKTRTLSTIFTSKHFVSIVPIHMILKKFRIEKLFPAIFKLTS